MDERIPFKMPILFLAKPEDCIDDALGNKHLKEGATHRLIEVPSGKGVLGFTNQAAMLTFGRWAEYSDQISFKIKDHFELLSALLRYEATDCEWLFVDVDPARLDHVLRFPLKLVIAGARAVIRGRPDEPQQA